MVSQINSKDIEMKLKFAVAFVLTIPAFLPPVNAQTASNAIDKTAVLATIDTMTNAFAAGDIETILSTYETGATVVGQPGMPVTGETALREMFAQFIAQGVAFTYGAHDVVLADDLALHLMKWTAPTPNGDAIALSVAVLRRQTDGSWKMVVDQPFGDAVMHVNAAQ